MRPEGIIRIATFDAGLSRKGPGLLLQDIARGKDPAIAAAIRVIARTDPDVLLLTGIDFDHSLAALTALQARLGVAQERISSAEIRNAAESSALQIARSDLLAIDPYDTATALQATQTQLETLYSITARLTRLNLTDYL